MIASTAAQNTGSMKSSVSHRNATVTAARKMKNQARSIRRCSIVFERIQGLGVVTLVHPSPEEPAAERTQPLAARSTCSRDPSARSGCRRSPWRRRTSGRAAIARAGRGTRRPCSPGSRATAGVFRTLNEMCVRPTRFHGTAAGGCCGWNSKISRTPPPGTRIQPILQLGGVARRRRRTCARVRAACRRRRRAGSRRRPSRSARPC